ncbi:MAG: AAA family ATPase [Candidatus Zixiibacteriota bacterium]|nr:MAG: AAA family ATPase [candidate division Zixibacteria bacterium]
MMNNRLKSLGFLDENENHRPTVVSVISGKGGVGKSVLAFNLAAVMAYGGLKSLIIDCDWNFGDQHVLTNVIPELTLADIVRNENLTYEATIHVKENLHLIASPASDRSGVEFSRNRLARLLEEIRGWFGEYHFIILDTPSGNLDIIRPTSLVSDLNLIVINPELTSIADGYGLFKFLMKSKNEIPACIFINRVDCETDYEYVYQKFTLLAGRFLGRVPLDGGYLLDDRHIVDSVAKQKPVVEISSDSPAVRQLNRLCKILTSLGPTADRRKELKNISSINSKTALAEIRK